ncbi:MAG: autotransporter-associated beta strand repeat-containing protein, partial [Planctomycetota bacterium]
MKSLFHKLTLAVFASASLAGSFAVAQQQQAWFNGRTDALNNEWTGFFSPGVNGNWSPTLALPGGSGRWPGQAAVGSVNNGSSTDIAFFGDGASNLTPTVGLNHTTTGGRLTLGGIGFRSTNTTFSIGNSSKLGDVPGSNPPSPAVAGILQLNGAAISTLTGQFDSSVSGGKLIVIGDGATRDASIVESNNGGQAGQRLGLGTANGEFYVTGGRQLGIFVAVTDEGNGRGFTKTGAGTMVLSQNNTFSGAVTISGGTLQVGNGGTTGNFGTTTATVNNSGVLAVNRTNTFTIANVIAGTGTVSNLGSGTTILTGNNSYGTTNISAGTIQVGNGSTSGTLGSGNVTNNGTLTFNRSDNVTVG